jgi:hypothetical protein
MDTYANLGGNSSVTSFAIDSDETGAPSIIVAFTDGSSYLYDSHSPGESVVQRMIALARRGQGLNSYITRHVRKAYAAKL